MIRSMTGFGKASRSLDGSLVTVEVSAVNQRYLDCVMHLPPQWAAIEAALKEVVRKHVSRGRLNVWMVRKRATSEKLPVLFDAQVARQYVDASKQLAKLLRTKKRLSIDTLAQLEGVFRAEEFDEDLDRIESVACAVLEEALVALNAMRATEGAALAQELKHRLAVLADGLKAVQDRLPEVTAAFDARLRNRLAELKAGLDVAEERLAVELAIMAEKGDVTEEIVRFKAHIEHALELIHRDEGAGRELNFLVQEMQREVNTLGAKVRDGDVARDVLAMKAELEKFREQIQNIE